MNLSEKFSSLLDGILGNIYRLAVILGISMAVGGIIWAFFGSWHRYGVWIFIVPSVLIAIFLSWLCYLDQIVEPIAKKIIEAQNRSKHN